VHAECTSMAAMSRRHRRPRFGDSRHVLLSLAMCCQCLSCGLNAAGPSSERQCSTDDPSCFRSRHSQVHRLTGDGRSESLKSSHRGGVDAISNTGIAILGSCRFRLHGAASCITASRTWIPPPDGKLSLWNIAPDMGCFHRTLTRTPP